MPTVGVGGAPDQELAVFLGLYGEATPAQQAINGVIGSLKKLGGATALAAGAFAILTGVTLTKAVKEFAKFEQELANIGKLVGQDMAAPVMEAVSEMSRGMPVARSELAGLAETAARLGVRGVDNITEFTRVTAMMGVATDISAQSAADAMARMLKQMQLGTNSLESMGSVINELSNTMATSASEIVASARRAAPELARIGVSAPDIFAMAASLNEVSESATRAGTRLRRVAQELVNPKKYEVFAHALGVTSSEFQKMRDEDPTDVILRLVGAMANAGNAADILATGLDTRVRQALQGLAQNYDTLLSSIETGREQWKQHNSLMKEYSVFVQTAASETQIIKNNMTDLYRELGKKLAPAIHAVTRGLIRMFDALDDLGLFGDKLETLMPADVMKDFNTQLERILLGETALQKWGSAFKELGSDLLNISYNLIQIATSSPAAIAQLERVVDSITAMDKRLRALVYLNAQALPSALRPAYWAAISEGMQRIDTKKPEEVKKLVDRINISLRNFEDISGEISNQDLLQDYMARVADAMVGAIETGNWAALPIQLGKINAEFLAMDKRQTSAKEHAQEFYDLWTKIADATVTMGESEKDMFKRLIDTGNWSPDELKTLLKLYDEYIAKMAELEAREQAEKKAQEELDRLHKIHQGIIDSFAGTEERRAENARKLAEQLWQEYLGLRYTNDELNKRAVAEANLKPGERETIENIQEMVAAQRAYNQALEDSQKAQKKYQDLVDRATFATVESRLRLIEDIVQDLSKDLLDTFQGLIDGSENFGQAFINTAQRVIRSILEMQLQMALFRAAMSIFPGLFPQAPPNVSWISSLPVYGSGGSIDANKMAIVGDKGPEVFIPSTNGSIIPNDRLDKLGGDTYVINHNWTVNAIDTQTMRSALAREKDFITGMTVTSIERSRAMKRGH